MSTKRQIYGLAMILLLATTTEIAQAQVNRTFVSGTGDDANPCSLAAPCRSFQAAYGAVSTGGEIVALDSAGYGALIVSKSVSIVAPDGVYAGITTTGTGINITGAGHNVYLRGLIIISTTRGALSSGVGVSFGSSVVLERCRIRGFERGMTSHGAKVVAKDCVISNCHYGLMGSGQPEIVNCVIDRSDSTAVYVTGGNWTVRGTLITGGLRGVVTTDGKVFVSDSVIFANETGVECNGVGDLQGIAYLDETLITGNTDAMGTGDGNGLVLSRTPLTNTIAGNTNDGFTDGTYAAK